MTRSRAQFRANWHSAVAAALSFLFPGLGQAYNGRSQLALILAIPATLVVLFGVIVVVVGGRELLSRLLDIRVLVALIVLDVALLGWRLVAIVQAYADRKQFATRSWPTWTTAVLVIAVIGMHGIPAYYAAKTIDTLGSVALEGGGAILDQHSGQDIEIPEPSFQPDLDRGERVTILLLGVDFAPGRDHHLTDTMLVATFDPESGESAMISVPRDLYGVPLPDGNPYDAKLNSLMSRASSDPASFPDGGPGTLKRTIGGLLGTRIHYFVAIDIEGFRRVIDAIGGVDVRVDAPLSDPGAIDPRTGQKGFHLDPGLHHMDGALALVYVQSRKGPGQSDFTRAQRQQNLLASLGRQMNAGNLVGILPALLDAVKSSVATDIPSGRIPELVRLVQDVDLSRLERIVLQPPEYVTPEPRSAAGYILHPNVDAIGALGRQIFGGDRLP